MRTEREAQTKIGRNLSILEKRKDNLSPRLEFYLGKEYFDNDRFSDAVEILKDVIKYPEDKLDLGDRILAHQYLCHSLLRMGKFQETIQFTLAALYMDSNRAEFYCFLGDAYAAQNKFQSAIPHYEAARACQMAPPGFSKIFCAPICYFEHPTMRLAQIFITLGDLDRAEMELVKVESLHEEAKKMLEYVRNLKKITNLDNAIENEDIVITCMPSPYKWDESIYQTNGLGGSETAAVEMAKHLAKLTNRKVIVFNQRDDVLHMAHGDQGVYYRPNREAAEYFNKWKPGVHIAWRHNMKITNAKTYLWCHDLVTPGAENFNNYNKIMCLSEFHKNYVQSCQAIPDEKIFVTRNGIEPSRFFKEMPEKIYGKVIWPSSPDRGLEHAIMIMDLVREKIPSATLDVFYGVENLYKYGLAEKAEMLKKMIAERPWITYYGMTEQGELTRAFARSDVWLYPATFIESSCIVAMEAQCCGVWPVVREIGALKNTLAYANSNHMCDMVDIDPGTDEGRKEYARLVVEAISERKHFRVKVDPRKLSWESVCREWIEEMKL